MTEPNLKIRQMSLDLSSPNHIPLNVRIAEFRQDPQNMDQMTEFVDDVIQNAQEEANKRVDGDVKAKVIFNKRLFLWRIKQLLFFLTENVLSFN